MIPNEQMSSKSLKKTKRVQSIIGYTLMILIAFFFLFPLFQMITTALNPDEMDVLRSMGTINAFIPRHFSFQNFINVFNRMPFGQYFFNSTLITVLTVFGGLVINSMLAFGLARFQFRGRGIIVAMVVALMIIPFEAIAVPLLILTNTFRWHNSYHVQIIPFLANPLYIFLLYQFFIGFPKALEEAALIDGASWMKIYWKIAIPLSGPILASVGILHFLMQWGFFLWPLMVTRGPTYMPLPVAMQEFFGQYPRLWGDIMSFASMITLPVIFLFVILQRQYVKSVAQTGIK